MSHKSHFENTFSLKMHLVIRCFLSLAEQVKSKGRAHIAGVIATWGEVGTQNRPTPADSF